ncbi:MAG: replication factor C large subunit [Candidatus Baldrarchaeia archaeon]|mgnify:CR=1 FL=1
MEKNEAPWTIKHAPKRIDELVNKDAVLKLLNFIKTWKPGGKVALIYGPPGTGKTISVYVIARELGYEVVEMNASDVRDAKSIMRIAGSAAMQMSLFGKKGKIILIDEVDGVSAREDRGGLKAIIDVIKSTQAPVVLTANDAWDPKLSSLRSVCELIEYKKVRETEIIRILKAICAKEGITVSPEILKMIAKNAEGDLRSAINDLEAIARGKKTITKEDLMLLAKRDREQNIFEVLRMIFASQSARRAIIAAGMADVDYEMLLQWINENIPHHMEDPLELANAYDALSRADVYLGRIHREQNWKLLSYAMDLMTAGVALARTRSRFKFVKYNFPSLIKEMSKTKEEREILNSIGEKIKRRCHVSVKRAITEYLPYIVIINRVNPSIGEKLLKWFDFNKNEIEYIKKASRV